MERKYAAGVSRARRGRTSLNPRGAHLAHAFFGAFRDENRFQDVQGSVKRP